MFFYCGVFILESVAVVISVYSIHRAKSLVACIDSLKKQTLVPKEIVVVLDPDYSLIAYYRKLLGSSVKIVISDAFGLSAARNIGIKNSISEIVAFIDDDAMADRNWLRNLVANFGGSSVIGAGGRIIPVWPAQNPEWFPEELYWIVGCSYKGLPTKKTPVRNPIGCNMAFRRQVFEMVGYFSTDTGRVGNKLMGHDDTEFGIRATTQLTGTKIFYDPTAIVYHRVSENRINLNYILKRSYSEGLSKAFVLNSHQINKGTINTEKKYLRTLILTTPSILLKGNLKTRLPRCYTLWFASTMVFLGYFIGSMYRC